MSGGLARCCSRRHSSIGTRTAVSTPRFVTICGPSVTLLSSNSLKRAFASCTGQRITGLPGDMTSNFTSHIMSRYKNLRSAEPRQRLLRPTGMASDAHAAARFAQWALEAGPAIFTSRSKRIVRERSGDPVSAFRRFPVLSRLSRFFPVVGRKNSRLRGSR